MLKLAVFVSGRGSNLRAIHTAVQSGTLDARIVLVLSSRDSAPALTWAAEHGIATASVQDMLPDEMERAMLAKLEHCDTECIALAGFMKRIPPGVVQRYSGRILNIHPALLPAFGGKGMYGQHVHEAVLASGARISGATVHLVDEEYDRGPIVLQRCVPVMDDDNIETLAARVLDVEHALLPEALALMAEGRLELRGGRVYIKK